MFNGEIDMFGKLLAGDNTDVLVARLPATLAL
jgi:hypothetical protein